MNSVDRNQFVAKMGELSVAFGNDITAEVVRVYFKHLSKQTIYQVCRSIDEIIEKDDKFPPVSRIRALADIKKKYPPQPMQDVEQIEEVVLSNDLPKNKEDFFKAMNKLYDDVSIN